MTTEQVDVVVVGMGPGGEDVAGRLAEAGLHVVGAEKSLVGGECPYWGCIPSKMMIRAAHALQEARRVAELGGKTEVVPDWGPVAARIRSEATDTWDDTVAVERFVGKGGHFVRGAGKVTGPSTVVVDGTTYEASRAVVIATGTRPAQPPIPGLDDVESWTNRDAVEATELPESIVVLGGGAIGAELAQVYARFGVSVAIVEALDRLLPAEEPEAGEAVGGAFDAEGIAVHVGAPASQVSADRGGVTVELGNGTTVRGERLLVATGRRANLDGIDLDALGVDPDSRWLTTDDDFRVTDGVWGVGDVIGRGAFTHVALEHASRVAAAVLGDEPADYPSHAVSRVTFTDPEVGAVGLTEAEAREQGIDVAVATKPVAHTARGWIHKAGNHGTIKLVADRRAGVLVGAMSAGPAGGEVLGLLSLAVHARVPIPELRRMIYAYPTFHKGIEDTLGDLEL